MKICVYTICKNEINNIDRWYESVKEADEIYVLDTGSTDGSFEKLSNLPKVTVVQKEIEPFNFSIAKTEAFKLLPEDTDVCVTIDIDEAFSSGWRRNLEKDERSSKYPTRSLYFSNFLNSTNLTTKYISHPYYSNLEWRFKIFEEPVVDSKSLWSWIDVPNPVISDILVYHYKDSSKTRNYTPMIEDKVLEGFSIIKRVCSKEQMLNTALSLIEPLDILNPSFYSLKEEIYNILRMRMNEIENSTEEIYFNYLLMTYSSKIGRYLDSLEYAKNLGRIISKIEEFSEQAILQDSLYIYLINNRIDLFRENVRKILLRFRKIKTLKDVTYFIEFLKRTLNLSEFLDTSTQEFLEKNLERAENSLDVFLKTGSFNCFLLKTT